MKAETQDELDGDVARIDERLIAHFLEGDIVHRASCMPGYGKEMLVRRPDGVQGNVVFDDVAMSTGNYLAAQSFRFAATRNEAARMNARRAVAGLRFLAAASGVRGLLVRYALEPTQRDAYGYSEEGVQGLASCNGLLIRPRVSIDQYVHALYGLYRYWQLAAVPEEREDLAGLVGELVDYIVDNGMTIPWLDGTVEFGDLSPQGLSQHRENHYATFALGVLALAWKVTGNERFRATYMDLTRSHGYAHCARDNFEGRYRHIWPEPMAFMLYPLLLELEDDPAILAIYRDLIEIGWQELPTRAISDDFEVFLALLAFDYAAITDNAEAAKQAGPVLAKALAAVEQPRILRSWSTLPFVNPPLTTCFSGVNELWVWWYGRYLGYV